MLYLDQPLTLELDDHTVYCFSDTEDPLQYYYMPNNPHLATLPDGRPAIRLVNVRRDRDELEEGEDDVVGFLSLDVDLSFPKEVMDALPSRIQSQLLGAGHTIEGTIRVAPLPYLRGTAKFLLLDAQSQAEDGDATTSDTPEPTEFVARTLQATSPSLYGDNRAIFQARLTKEGAAAIQASIDGVAPIGVIYELVYVGLRPAYRFSIKANLDQVYDHLSERFSVDVPFFNSDIRKVTDELIRDEVITVEGDIMGVGAEGMEGDFTQARDKVLDWVIEHFFNFSFSKAHRGPTAIETIRGVGRAVAQAAVTAGWGVIGSVGYTRKEYEDIEKRSIDVQWSIRKAVERRIFPQGHVYTLLDEAGVSLDDVTTTVDVEQVFDQLDVTVSTDADWKGHGISAIAVNVRYGGEEEGDEVLDEWSELLTPENTLVRKRGWADPAIGDRIQVQYEVVFDGSIDGPATKLSTDWQARDGTVVVLQPRELFDDVRLSWVTLGDLSWERWSGVQVYYRYTPSDGSYQLSGDKLLRSGDDTWSVRFRTDLDEQALLEHRTVSFGVGGAVHDTGWLPLDERNVAVADPFPQKLMVRVRPVRGRKTLETAIVMLEYIDDDNGVFESTELVFEGDDLKKSQSWTVHLADPEKRRYRYMASLFFDDGSFLQTDWIDSEAALLPVGDLWLSKMTASFRVLGEVPDDVEAIELDLRYEDAANEHVVDEHVVLHREGDVFDWAIGLKDPSLRRYTYTVTWKTSSGFHHTLGPVQSDSAFPIVPGAPPED